MTRGDRALLVISAAVLAALLAVACRNTPSLSNIAYLLYSLGLAADLAGATLAVLDLRHRLPLLRAFRTETAGPLPMIYNELPAVAEILATRDPVVLTSRMRAGFNEVILALDSERQAREATDDKLATLSGVGENLGQLKLAVALLVGGAVLGGVGNIIGQAAG